MLKCKMIFSLPTEYLRLYEGFKEGGTIREWINKVESLSASTVCHDAETNMRLLRLRLAGEWEIAHKEDIFSIRMPGQGKIESEALAWLRQAGEWDGKSWHVSRKDVEWLLYEDEINKFKGDMLEVLSEMFFQRFGADEAVGLMDYCPVDIGADYGVDATGRNANGHKCAVQVKYRSNPASLISYADIARTYTSAVQQLHLEDVHDHDRTIFLFTTATGVTGPFEKVMGRKCVVIGRAAIATKIDNNKNFWAKAHEEMFETLDS